MRAKAVVVARLEAARARAEVEASAVAEAAAPRAARGGMPAMASGGGYSGPLVYRDGEGMRPDVAAAFDRMAAAARGAASRCWSSPAFAPTPNRRRSSPPIPTRSWVAPPGHSLHRCATELDLGPDSAYGWLAANASRFGFVQRYSWEAWHYGFDAGPPPCSEAGNAVGGSGGEGALPGGGGPAGLRPGPLPGAAAARRRRAGTSPPPCWRRS